jgi:hypothetical protein
MLRHVVWYILADVSEVLAASIIKEIAQRIIPEDNHLHTCHRENLKSHQDQL